MRKIWILSLAAAILVSLSLFTFNIFGKGDALGQDAETKQLSEKIDRILKNQEDIITRLAEIRQELDIIRVRASRR